MKKILLATTLLSIAVSENILMENHPRLKTWICDKQLWNRRIKRISRKDIPTIEESLNYEDDRQFPRNSDTRFVSESRKLPSTIIRNHELAQFSQDDLSVDKSKLDTKPRFVISIGIQEEKNAGSDLQKDCSKRKNYVKNNQGWQLQQPFYVEEPTWVDIDIDYRDSSQRTNNGDPYILTRGKKIYRIKDPEEMSKIIGDYEATLDYPSKSKKLLIKRRVRRSAKMNEGFYKTADIKNNQIKEKMTHYDFLQDMSGDTNNIAIEIENRGKKSSKIDKISEEVEKPKDTSYDVPIKKDEKNDLKNLAKRSLRGYKFIKQNQIFANGIITDFIEQKQKIQREDVPDDTETGSSKTAKIDEAERFNNSKNRFVINVNKRNKKSMLPENQELPEIRKKDEIYEIDANSKKDVEKNETYEQMKNSYVNKLNEDTHDKPFISSQNKDPFDNGIKKLSKMDTDRKTSIEKAWKLYYAHLKKLESKGETRNEEDRLENDKDNIGIIDSQLTNESNSEIKTSNDREKRDACKNCKIKSFQDEWLKAIEKKIQASLSLERRDKHSDILERLGEPYIISRGKKAPGDFGKDVLPSLLNSQNMNDEDRAKMMSLPIAESLLRMGILLMSGCNSDNNNANRLSDERLSPRDRRGTLDEIFAGYDPYYVVRGKRMNRYQKDVSFETDARQ